MNVIRRPVDAERDAFEFADDAAHIGMETELDMRMNQRAAIFRTENEMHN